MNRIKLWGLVATLVCLVSCNDRIDVRQDYDFSLSTWYLQSGLKQGEAVEIRFTLLREGYFSDAAY